jgi:hypothetical protein
MPDFFEFPVERSPLGGFEKGRLFLIATDLIAPYQPVERWRLMDEILPTVLEPCYVLPDLKRSGFENAVAYSRSLGESRHVCMVYADYRVEAGGLVIFDFEPRMEDLWRKGLPDNFGIDFGEPLWTRG